MTKCYCEAAQPFLDPPSGPSGPSGYNWKVELGAPDRFGQYYRFNYYNFHNDEIYTLDWACASTEVVFESNNLPVCWDEKREVGKCLIQKVIIISQSIPPNSYHGLNRETCLRSKVPCGHVSSLVSHSEKEMLTPIALKDGNEFCYTVEPDQSGWTADGQPEHYTLNNQRRGLPKYANMYLAPVECVGYCKDKVNGMIVAQDEEGSFNKTWSLAGPLKLPEKKHQIISELRSYLQVDDMCDGCS